MTENESNTSMRGDDLCHRCPCGYVTDAGEQIVRHYAACPNLSRVEREAWQLLVVETEDAHAEDTRERPIAVDETIKGLIEGLRATLPRVAPDELVRGCTWEPDGALDDEAMR
jgi:hypothetical protein